MNEKTKKQMADSIRDFHLPRFDKLPDVGYYLEQTVTYINQYIEPLGCPPITSAMVGNYAKSNVIPGPVKKLYYNEQIAHLMVIAILKNVLSLENICKLFCMKKGVYTDQVAYDYFCSELENILFFTFGVCKEARQVGVTNSDLKIMLRGAIIAASQIIYLERCFDAMEAEKE